MAHGMLGQNGNVGEMERGKMAPFHFTRKCVSFCTNALVRFPHAHSTYENFGKDSV